MQDRSLPWTLLNQLHYILCLKEDSHSRCRHRRYNSSVLHLLATEPSGPTQRRKLLQLQEALLEYIESSPEGLTEKDAKELSDAIAKDGEVLTLYEKHYMRTEPHREKEEPRAICQLPDNLPGASIIPPVKPPPSLEAIAEVLRTQLEGQEGYHVAMLEDGRLFVNKGLPLLTIQLGNRGGIWGFHNPEGSPDYPGGALLRDVRRILGQAFPETKVFIREY